MSIRHPSTQQHATDCVCFNCRTPDESPGKSISILPNPILNNQENQHYQRGILDGARMRRRQVSQNDQSNNDVPLLCRLCNSGSGRSCSCESNRLRDLILREIATSKKNNMTMEETESEIRILRESFILSASKIRQAEFPNHSEERLAALPYDPVKINYAINQFHQKIGLSFSTKFIIPIPNTKNRAQFTKIRTAKFRFLKFYFRSILKIAKVNDSWTCCKNRFDALNLKTLLKDSSKLSKCDARHKFFTCDPRYSTEYIVSDDEILHSLPICPSPTPTLSPTVTVHDSVDAPNPEDTRKLPRRKKRSAKSKKNSDIPVSPIENPGEMNNGDDEILRSKNEETPEEGSKSTGLEITLEPKPATAVDIGTVISKRLKAMKELQENPDDSKAKEKLEIATAEMKEWAEAKALEPKFLTPAELLTGPQAWAKKDQLKTATAVQVGMGMHLLQRMGWNPGEGLGKNKEGSTEPLALEIKADKKGLSTASDKGASLPSVFDLSGKHPVSSVMELCAKRRWGDPTFLLCFEYGPSHRKQFVYKVTVNGVEYQPCVAMKNKKEAKANAAAFCLQSISMGLLPTPKNTVTIPAKPAELLKTVPDKNSEPSSIKSSSKKLKHDAALMPPPPTPHALARLLDNPIPPPPPPPPSIPPLQPPPPIPSLLEELGTMGMSIPICPSPTSSQIVHDSVDAPNPENTRKRERQLQRRKRRRANSKNLKNSDIPVSPNENLVKMNNDIGPSKKKNSTNVPVGEALTVDEVSLNEISNDAQVTAEKPKKKKTNVSSVNKQKSKSSIDRANISADSDIIPPLRKRKRNLICSEDDDTPLKKKAALAKSVPVTKACSVALVRLSRNSSNSASPPPRLPSPSHQPFRSQFKRISNIEQDPRKLLFGAENAQQYDSDSESDIDFRPHSKLINSYSSSDSDLSGMTESPRSLSPNEEESDGILSEEYGASELEEEELMQQEQRQRFNVQPFIIVETGEEKLKREEKEKEEKRLNSERKRLREEYVINYLGHLPYIPVKLEYALDIVTRKLNWNVFPFGAKYLGDVTKKELQLLNSGKESKERRLKKQGFVLKYFREAFGIKKDETRKWVCCKNRVEELDCKAYLKLFWGLTIN